MALLMNFFQSYFIGTEPWETALSLDQRINDLLYQNDWPEIYIGTLAKQELVQKACIWNIDTGRL
jgi:hypothetical protein